jgi:hypothetical protein
MAWFCTCHLVLTTYYLQYLLSAHAMSSAPSPFGFGNWEYMTALTGGLYCVSKKNFLSLSRCHGKRNFGLLISCQLGAD